MQKDLYGQPIEKKRLKIYADEIQEVENIVTGEKWLYSGAIYELESRPILKELIDTRYWKDKSDWRNYREKNDSLIHWAEIANDHNKKNVIKRWLEWLVRDCAPQKRRFHFSIHGINLTKLHEEEFGTNQQFNNIYNRFFRSMLQRSIKSFFKGKIVITDVFHEEGQQQVHKNFPWHLMYKLKTDPRLEFKSTKINFLPKSHRDSEGDKRSNIIQLGDVLLGIFKDLHCGVNLDTYPENKKEILETEFVRKLLVRRIIRNPSNINSSYGYFNRFSISLFPKYSSVHRSLYRKIDNYYDLSKITLGYYYQRNPRLFP
ncbi:hypothetical protein GF360_03170 [candidate division WWE3 bacterium]|nr:hypothetical protein [candidate division WWE3 bacterium]